MTTIRALGWDHERCMRPMRACAAAWHELENTRPPSVRDGMALLEEGPARQGPSRESHAGYTRLQDLDATNTIEFSRMQ